MFPIDSFKEENEDYEQALQHYELALGPAMTHLKGKLHVLSYLILYLFSFFFTINLFFKELVLLLVDTGSSSCLNIYL